jgi:protein gp37
VEEGVAFFFKQWGGPRPKSNGRRLDGQLWDQRPSAQIRDAALAAP